jgi:hypothetical protein
MERGSAWVREPAPAGAEPRDLPGESKVVRAEARGRLRAAGAGDTMGEQDAMGGDPGRGFGRGG